MSPRFSSGRQQETPEIHLGPRRVLYPSNTTNKSEPKRSMAVGALVLVILVVSH